MSDAIEEEAGRRKTDREMVEGLEMYCKRLRNQLKERDADYELLLKSTKLLDTETELLRETIGRILKVLVDAELVQCDKTQESKA